MSSIRLKALETFGTKSKTSILTWCIPTYAWNNKLVKIWTKLFIEVAREKLPKNTLFAQNNVCAFRCKIKGFTWCLLLFDYFIIWVRNYLLLKNYFSERVVFTMLYTINSSPLLVKSCYTRNYFELLQIVSSVFNDRSPCPLYHLNVQCDTV